MNTASLQTLINFRAGKQLIESFDRVCLLSGKTRTQVLTEMMRQRVLSVGSKLPSKLALEESINQRLKTAVEGRSDPVTSDRPREWSSAVRNRLKPFSSPDFDPQRGS